MIIRMEVNFYSTDANNEPVKKWLDELSKEDKKTIGEDIKTVQEGWPVGMPTARHLRGKLYEVRSDISDKRKARVIFAIIDSTVLLLHAFIKKSQRTPDSDIKIAEERLRRVLNE